MKLDVDYNIKRVAIYSRLKKIPNFSFYTIKTACTIFVFIVENVIIQAQLLKTVLSKTMPKSTFQANWGIIPWNKIKSDKHSQELSAELSWPWFSFRHYTYAPYAHPQTLAPNPHPACERVIKHEAPLLAARL